MKSKPQILAELAEEPREYSVYFGRERLGRYVQVDKKTFEAFGKDDRLLGTFRKEKEARKAIYAEADDCP
ncbi:hypothetical protein [Bradyrhizobium sp. NC92]|uniref:hypothetical protein n=1 Tax=Bradyrhizobium sp. (strain NC92) TaxID=55395 RepID=UPI0021A9AB78|nr:hypothetical protein [Bradyrhizobium sp. NC92]UWU69458.1 hypothetical protein N2602_02700 [Bradyrhizobium sp. NC92]